ncbi:MAG: Holliday junction branch migration DNA helicase RuvB [Firmicutes bacterium]|nr:Holliday junction branch migration DNA helicase RuvB [Bacillota bacterium]
MDDRIVSTSMHADEEYMENRIRPQRFEDFSGQTAVVDNLKIYMQAAKIRGEALDHVLFYGPPGLGKTTLAGIIAREMEGHFYITSGPALSKPIDLAAVLTGIEAGDVLFIDEIHRLNRVVEEILYSVMEDFRLDIMLSKGMGAGVESIDIPKFTLIGATTRAGSLSAPLRDRFGIVEKFDLYNIDELSQILRRSAGILGVDMDEASVKLLAKRSRGTPRVANRLLKRVRDFSQVKADGTVSTDVVQMTLDALRIDSLGLDSLDRRILEFIITKYHGGPVGIDTIAASLGEERVTIEDVCEPYLMQLGLLQRTPKGRMVSDEAYRVVGLPKDADASKKNSGEEQLRLI